MKRYMLLLAGGLLLAACGRPKTPSIDLAGTWEFAIDSLDRGMAQRWYLRTLEDRIVLPGSMNTEGKGDRVTAATRWTASVPSRAWYEAPEYAPYRRADSTKVVFFLQPDRHYVGPAWYRKPIDIPPAWAGRTLRLRFERCHWETRLWVDDREAGSANSLGTPHEYLLDGFAPGRHMLTVRIDNRIGAVDPGPDAHSLTDHTQGNWNGMTGELSLEALPEVSIERVKITPDPRAQVLHLAVAIRNFSGRIQPVELSARGKVLKTASLDCDVLPGTDTLALTVPWKEELKPWDEFSPNLYDLRLKLRSPEGTQTLTETFGVRTIATRGTQITLNGRPLFLRGTLECCIFPLTGYPPTGEAAWERIIRICKDHGLNHMRFHSWCPPQAAFRAADRLGFYFQVECGAWAHDIGSGKGIDDYIRAESRRIVEAYGNHPSFCLLAYGNEPYGPHMEAYLHDFVEGWKARDRRFLVTTAAGWPAYEGSDYDNLPRPRIQGWGEELRSIINAEPPRSDFDWRERIDPAKPTVSHEIGQWCVYPDLKERAQYTGAYQAKNFDIFEDRLRASGLLHLADSFLLASGKLQALCYKADIEAALRTPGFGGFQLLDLHDFPGQGTALVGVLNPFWQEKGYITAREFRNFCSPVVPLLRTDRFLYESGDTLRAGLEVAQFGPEDLPGSRLTWTLSTPAGDPVAQGSVEAPPLPTGALTRAGELILPLTAARAQQYRLSLSLDGKYENAWNLWVYPRSGGEELPQAAPGIRVSRRLGPREEAFLASGGSLLLIPGYGILKNEGADSVCPGFSTIFWNTLWTNNQAPHTLGILCDPNHPALSRFPTACHTDYQWWDALSRCNALPMHRLGSAQPIVRLIDDWFKGRSLGLIAEMNVGNGKVLLCGADLLWEADHRLGARQLGRSLLHYMASDAFRPQGACTPAQIRSLMR